MAQATEKGGKPQELAGMTGGCRQLSTPELELQASTSAT
jgi:hypothetical protein